MRPPCHRISFCFNKLENPLAQELTTDTDQLLPFVLSLTLSLSLSRSLLVCIAPRYRSSLSRTSESVHERASVTDRYHTDVVKPAGVRERLAERKPATLFSAATAISS